MNTRSTRGGWFQPGGLDIAVREYDDNFVEEHVSHSNALHSVLKSGGAYFVGPMARYNLNFDWLAPPAQRAAREAGLGSACRNPFKSIIVRAVEILHAPGAAGKRDRCL